MNTRQSISRSSSNTTVEIVIHNGDDGNVDSTTNEYQSGSGKYHSPNGSRPISPSNSFSLSDKQSPFSFGSDFILVSEFSELEGPVPLFVIPETGCGTFNLDDFVVKVMAVDHQTKSTDPEDSLRDTQVVTAYPKENAHAYVHHFTLLDVFARGYVRPLAVSYITHDSKKIMNHFSEFLEAFSKISNTMKSSNREIFKHDLALRIADAEHTQQTVLQSKETEAILPASSSVTEYVNDLKQLHKKLNKSSETLDSFENTNIKELNINQLGEEDYKPQLIHSITKNAYFHKKTGLRTLDELCGDGFEKAKAQLNLAYVHFSRPSIVLSLEKEDEMVMSPSSSMLSFGNNILLNFNLVADKRSRQTSLEVSRTPVSSSQSTPVPTNAFVVGSVHFSSSSTGSSFGSFGSLSSNLCAFPIFENSNEKRVENSKEKETEEQKENQIKTENNAILNPADHLSALGYFNAQHQQFLNDPNFTLESFGSILWGFSKSFHGQGIMDFRYRYSHAKHVIFSLLKGRTVVISASAQHEIPVRRIIGALSLFVPGHWGKRPRVVPWQTRSLKISDLAFIKLIGIAKTDKNITGVPKTLEKYITLFDFDNETLNTVPYTGEILEEMLNVQKRWPDEDTFLAHIHQQLYELSCTASLYYHLCCIGVTPPNNDSEKHGEDKKASSQDYDDTLRHTSLQVIGQSKFSTSVDLPSDQLKNTKNKDKKSFSDSNLGMRSASIGTIRETNKDAFFRQMNVRDGDAEIIEYLAELVKQQQLLEMYGIEHVSPPIRLDYTKCTFLVNTIKHKRLSSN